MTSGREALQLLEQGELFDVIFCDVMMPDVGGAELFETLKVRRPDLVERVVFITGGAFTREASDFLGSVPNAVLEKPFEVDALSRMVGQQLGRTG